MKEGAFLVRLVCSLLGTACLAALGVVAVAAPAGAQAQMGAITGSVDDAATGAVLAGICVYAYPVSAYGPRTAAVLRVSRQGPVRSASQVRSEEALRASRTIVSAVGCGRVGEKEGHHSWGTSYPVLR